MKKVSFLKSKRNEAGFSLLELSAIIAVSATLAVGYVSWVMPATQNNAVKSLETHRRIKVITDAIQTFVINNKRLPCPANPHLNSQTRINTNSGATNNYDFDDEALSIGTTITCPAPSGALPTRALGIPAEYMLDGWGRRLFYRVASDLCGTTECTARSYKRGITTVTTGGLSVKNSTLSTGTFFANNTAAFVLISYGTNGIGAYLPSGNTIGGTNADADERANNSLLPSTGYYVKHGIVPGFDDLVTFQTKSQIDSLANAITAADFITCRNNSVALSNIDRTVADSLKTSVTALQVVSGTTTYNTGDAAILEVMWNLQEACYAIYGSSLARMCPAGLSYNQNTNSCICPTGRWSSTTC